MKYIITITFLESFPHQHNLKFTMQAFLITKKSFHSLVGMMK